jgi:hypothetical protein
MILTFRKTCFLIVLVLIQCYGPALSKKYVCENELSDNSSYMSCFYIFSTKNPTQEQLKLRDECFLLSIYIDENNCKNKSNIEPWWL